MSMDGAKEEDNARHLIVTEMTQKTGSMATVSEEDEAKHLIVAIVAKEVNKTTRLKDSRMYSRMYMKVNSSTLMKVTS